MGAHFKCERDLRLFDQTLRSIAEQSRDDREHTLRYLWIAYSADDAIEPHRIREAVKKHIEGGPRVKLMHTRTPSTQFQHIKRAVKKMRADPPFAVITSDKDDIWGPTRSLQAAFAASVLLKEDGDGESVANFTDVAQLKDGVEVSGDLITCISDVISLLDQGKVSLSQMLDEHYGYVYLFDWFLHKVNKLDVENSYADQHLAEYALHEHVKGGTGTRMPNSVSFSYFWRPPITKTPAHRVIGKGIQKVTIPSTAEAVLQSFVQLLGMINSPLDSFIRVELSSSEKILQLLHRMQYNIDAWMNAATLERGRDDWAVCVGNAIFGTFHDIQFESSTYRSYALGYILFFSLDVISTLRKHGCTITEARFLNGITRIVVDKETDDNRLRMNGDQETGDHRLRMDYRSFAKLSLMHLRRMSLTMSLRRM